MATPCPVCGSTTAPKFDATSSWCAPCSDLTLLDQQLEDTNVIEPEITPPLCRSRVRIEYR